MPRLRVLLLMPLLLAISAGAPSVALAAATAEAVAPSVGGAWRVVGQIGGPVSAVAVDGTTAFIGVGLRLVVLDVSDPAKPVELGATAPFPHLVEDVFLQGRDVPAARLYDSGDGPPGRLYAYVAAGGAGLRIVDVSDPTHPIEVGAWDSPGYAEGVAGAGDVAYLADGPYGLRVVDVSDPGHPVPLGAAFDMAYAFDVAVAARHVPPGRLYAHIAAAGAGLLIVDVTDPLHPVGVGTLDTPGYAYGVAVDGAVAYVADGWEGVRVVDVADPARPGEIASLAPPGWAFGIALSGRRGYVAAAFGGLQVLDVADPRQPTLLGGLITAGRHVGSVAVSGSLALVADPARGLRVIDVKEPAQPVVVGVFESIAYATGVSVAGDHAYLSTSSQGLRVIDVTDPGMPAEVGHYEELPTITGVVAQNNLVYADYFFGAEGALHILDVSDPQRPRRLGAAGRSGNDMEIMGGVAYLSDESGLTLVSVADPANPYPLGSIQIQEYPGGPGTTNGVAVSGELAYVAAQHEGVKIVDVSDPDHPALYGEIRCATNYTLDLVIQDSIAYLADLGGLRIVDVSDARHPRERSYLYLGIDVYDINVAGNLAFMERSTLGVTAVDVTDPALPVVVAEIDTLGSADEVAVVGDRLYIADGPGGLVIYERIAQRISPGLGAESRPLATTGPAVITSSPRSGRADPLAFPRPAPLPDVLPAPPMIDLPVAVATAARPAGRCVVISTADSGVGTLRACLASAVAGDAITFDPAVFPPARPTTITLVSALPALSQGRLTLDASGAGVVLDGSQTPDGTPGIFINSNDNVIQGIQVLNFPHTGIWIHDASGNRIGGDRVRGESNRVSGNAYRGIGIDGAAATDNEVSGNLVGVDVTGTRRQDNGIGILLGDGAQRNMIGGAEPGQGNVVGGASGIVLEGAATAHNTIRGNLVGTDISGTHLLASDAPPPCCHVGITLIDGAHHNVIGPGNVVNGFDSGIALYRRGTADNRVLGNRVGTDAAGAVALGNRMTGILIAEGATDNLIGGSAAAERNLASGNTGSGIAIDGVTTSGNVIAGNYLGVDAAGQAALPNGNGISLWSPGNRVAGNLASGNIGGGITMLYGDSHDNLITGNWCGVDASGAVALPNLNHGISAEGGAWGNRIEGNLTSGNARAGILASDPGADYHTIVGNRVGVDVSGTRAIANGWVGISVGIGSFNRIGGTGPGEGNVVIGGSAASILVATSVGSVVVGNFVGTDVTGQPLGSSGTGILLDSGVRAAVGGLSLAERNVIAGNREGVRIQSSGNYVAGNAIGTDASSRLALGNSFAGATVWYGSHNVIQGNRIAGERSAGAERAQFAIHIESGRGNTLRRNEVDGSQEPAIRLDPGANADLPAPIILNAALDQAGGMACPDCTVEVFSDDEDEGRLYEGNAVADAAGSWTFVSGHRLTGPYLTATATDAEGNTSEFSAAVALHRLWLPLVPATSGPQG